MKKIVSFAVSALIVAALLMSSAVMAACPVKAYIDPSVTTYAIQAIAGIAVAVGAFVAIFWRKAKKKVAKTLNIDENAKKEVEEDVVVFDENENKEISENNGGADSQKD